MKLFDNILNRLGYTRDAERAYFTSRIQRLGSRGAVYIDTEVPYNLVNSIPQLKLAIDKLAAMFSNAYLVKENIKTGEIMQDEDLQKLLENPNIIQSQNEFLKQYISQLVVYGNQFLYKTTSGVSKYPTSIKAISPAHLTPILTGKYFEQFNLDGIIKEYQYCEDSAVRRFGINEILWSKIADLDHPIQGCSPLKALRYPLTNTKYAYDYLNVISADKGAIGMLSTAQKDGMGAIPMTPEEKEKIESSYRSKYGTADGQARIHLTEGTVTWTPMTYPTQQLLLLEQIEANFKTILDVLGINPNIFINSTYENLKNGLIMTYQDTIIPYADGFTQALTKFLGLKEGERIVAKFDHISILKEDKSKDLEDLKSKTAALTQLVNTGIISNVQAEELMAAEIGIDMQERNKLQTGINNLSPLVANKVLATMTINEIRSLSNLDPIDGGDKLPTEAPPQLI